ncbi:MAG TPA: hypothetical protein VMH79_09855 [Thermoanaerobaculia bacterium]|nr:hypothetical protein [Thermoanaerobaculia bacterium]
MIDRLRSAAPARAALCAAALLSIAASFGLHPEPAGGFAPAPAPGIASSVSLAAPSHGCIACLSGGSALVAIASLLAPATESVPVSVAAPYAPPARFWARLASGRAPPAAASF